MVVLITVLLGQIFSLLHLHACHETGKNKEKTRENLDLPVFFDPPG